MSAPEVFDSIKAIVRREYPATFEVVGEYSFPSGWTPTLLKERQTGTLWGVSSIAELRTLALLLK